jgi:hypothetical protein
VGTQQSAVRASLRGVHVRFHWNFLTCVSLSASINAEAAIKSQRKREREREREREGGRKRARNGKKARMSFEGKYNAKSPGK